MIAFEIPGEPVAFARAGSNGSRRFNKPKQSAYGEVVKTIAAARMAGKPLLKGPLTILVRADYAYPSSWSAKKKDRTRWKTSAPDADNIMKLLLDSLNKIVYRDDAQVVEAHVQKQYTTGPERLLIPVQAAP